MLLALTMFRPACLRPHTIPRGENFGAKFPIAEKNLRDPEAIAYFFRSVQELLLFPNL